MCIVKDILIDESIFGTFTIPKKNGNFPGVLMLPGFASHKDEIANIYVLFSLTLAQIGIATLRIDYPSCGKSPGNPLDFSLTKALNGATKALRFLQFNEFVDKNKLGICGFSMGAAIAIMLTKETLGVCKALLMLSPAKCLIEDFSGVLGKETINKGLTLKDNDTLSFNYPVDGEITELRYRRSFFTSLAALDTDDAAKKYKNSLLIIAGQNDFSHKNAIDYLNLSTCAQKRMVSLPETDHILNIFSTNSRLTTVTEEAIGFFKAILINSPSHKIENIRAKL